MKLEILVGQTLDNKYKVERELGRGGMGTVYLATHLGTERPVAVKVIAPQFMERLEFVERFRREARAAGRLRHPNVVNVTDFGLADTKIGRVAYLVMEYLDGCTLGEILEEEKKLPLSWSIDILEQVSSAVHLAHEQGIIHRDLKPDNIWLEPNQRGGYTVKVLDFGIAKLEETVSSQVEVSRSNYFANITQGFQNKETVAGEVKSATLADASNSTAVSESDTMAMTPEPRNGLSEAGTLIQSNPIDLEGGTAILHAPEKQTVSQQENVGTKIMSAPFETEKEKESKTNDSFAGNSQSNELTHVGAVLGTPLYMSPEQCRGEKLTARSDIYSLAVIAYQMLGGKTPFGGDFTQVMQAHKETAPPPLEVKKVPRKVKKIIFSSLAKNPDERPQTAEAFASELRAQSEGIGSLLRRALTIYSEHLPKFLGLTLFLYIPLIVFTALKIGVISLYIGDAISGSTSRWLNVVLSLATAFVGIFCGYLIMGTTTWIVTQLLAMPLRPVSVRAGLRATGRKWKTFAGTGFLSTFLIFLGLAACFFGFPVLWVLFALVAPVVMMENLRGRAALKRSTRLVRRSLGTTVAAMFVMFLVPMCIMFLTSFFVATTIKAFSDTKNEIVAAVDKEKTKSTETANTAAAANTAEKNGAENGIQVSFGSGNKIQIDDNNNDMPHLGGINGVVHELVTSVLMLPLQILLTSLSSIIIALLYIKTRLVGGESMHDLLAQFEEADRPRSNWQKRIRKRLEQSGKQLSKP